MGGQYRRYHHSARAGARAVRAPPAALLAIALALLAGCAGGLGGGDYSRSDARRAWRVQYAEVLRVEPVRIEGEHSALGTAGGAAVGYSLGRVVGDGSGSRVAGAAGAVAGAVAGREAEEALTAEDGLEITLRLERGGMLVVVQSADVAFSPGERVRVLRGRGDAARVLRL